MKVFPVGLLAFLGYYELVSGLSLPLRFTVERVTHVYLFQGPLLGSLEVDLAAYVFAALYVSVLEDRRRFRLLQLAAVVSSMSVLVFGCILGLTSLIHVALGVAGVLSSTIYAWGRGLKVLLPGVVFSVVLLEASALAAYISYYVNGGWDPVWFQLAIRERLVWSSLEWIAVPLLILAVWRCFCSVVTGRVKSGRKTEGGSGSWLLLPVAVLLTVLLVLLPHLPSVNPALKPVSVDTVRYGKVLEGWSGLGVWEAMRSRAEKPLFTLVLYYSRLAFGRNHVILLDVVYPAFVLSMFCVASFYACYRLYGSRTAGWAGLLIPLGYAVPAFIGGGFQANALALVLAMLALSVEVKDGARLATFTLLMTALALIHPWTYVMYGAAFLVRAFRDRGNLKSTAAALALSYTVSHLFDYYLGSIQLSSVVAQPIVKHWNFYLVTNWFDAVQLWVWNSLSNPLFLSAPNLALGGSASYVMAVTAPLTLVLPSDILYRVLLNLPLHLPASRAIARLQLRYRLLTFLVLFVRVLGNMSGLTVLT